MKCRECQYGPYLGWRILCELLKEYKEPEQEACGEFIPKDQKTQRD